MDINGRHAAEPSQVSFGPLLAALSGGVGTVTLCVVETTYNPTIGLLLGVVAMFGFAGLVLYEVGRLLGDDGSAS